jgi:ribonuclease BN (tRNA processing enzyme)
MTSFGRRNFIGAAGAMTLVPLVKAFAKAPASGAQKMRLILLGTGGGPTPKKLRGAPAQAIVIGDATYIVDCGNGVARQMAMAGLPFKSIRDIFITHHHSDHNADYGNLLLLAWATDLAHPVNTYGPPPLVKMTELFLELNDYDIKTRIADEGRPPLAPLIQPHEISLPGLVMQDDRVKVTATLVNHPPVVPAFAYRFDSAERSIVISGDTTPSDNLIALAQNADVLVHEVMHLPSIEKLIAAEPNAQRLREHLLAAHTTCEQLGVVAAKAYVKTLVLSHFVPGGIALDDATWTDPIRANFKGNIIVGQDLMEI